MKCSHVTVEGKRVIVCGPARFVANCDIDNCKSRAGFKCDWILPSKLYRCDKDLCVEHATQVGKNKHVCPEHAEDWANHPSNKQRKLL